MYFELSLRKQGVSYTRRLSYRDLANKKIYKSR